MAQYPLQMIGKIFAFNPQVSIKDANGSELLYVKQKALAIKEDVKVFSDSSQSKQLYQIKADRRIDFNANYAIATVDGQVIGKMGRKGMVSLWKAHYDFFDANGNDIGDIDEENPWVKVLDALLSEIPLVGMWINPAYIVKLGDTPVLRLKKQPSFGERKFEVQKLADFPAEMEPVLLNTLIMAMLLERNRG
jgi:uncharacterized protein YxjI